MIKSPDFLAIQTLAPYTFLWGRHHPLKILNCDQPPTMKPAEKCTPGNPFWQSILEIYTYFTLQKARIKFGCLQQYNLPIAKTRRSNVSLLKPLAPYLLLLCIKNHYDIEKKKIQQNILFFLSKFLFDGTLSSY